LRGDRNSSWLVVRRGLAVVRRLMRGPATRDELLSAVRGELGPDAYSEPASAAARALKNDRALIKEHLGIEIEFDRRLGTYLLKDVGDTPWLDLSDDALAAMAAVYNAFEGAGPEGRRACELLDVIAGLLPAERLETLRRRRPILTMELREVDEAPVPAPVSETLRRAILERHRLRFSYRAAGQPWEAEASALAGKMLVSEGVWLAHREHLVAHGGQEVIALACVLETFRAIVARRVCWGAGVCTRFTRLTACPSVRSVLADRQPHCPEDEPEHRQRGITRGLASW